MTSRLFHPTRAVGLLAGALMLALILMVASPVRNTVVIAPLMLYAIGYLCIHRASLTLTRGDRWVLLMLSAYLLSQLPVFVLSGYSSRYLSPGLHMAAAIPVYLMLRHTLRHSDHRLVGVALEAGVIVAALGAGLVALWQTQWLGESRADGFLFSINFGYLCALLFGMALTLMQGARWPYWLGLAALSALLAVLLSGTRGAMLAIPPVLLLLGACRLKQLGWRPLALGLALMAAAVSLGSQAFDGVEQRMASIGDQFSRMLDGDLDNSAGYRLQLWNGAWEATLQRPLVGSTYPEREAINRQLAERGEVSDWVAGVKRGHAHSQYFELLATGGLLGALALIAMLVAPGLYYLRQALRNPGHRYAASGVIVTLTVALCGLTESLLQQEMIAASYGLLQATLLGLSQEKAT
ncbi:O-antigen ligase family protein [Halomonas salifodinae]|uniref:O-antigen ligase family protein n=1 Tax=Halomonas salifodinae TaxID=438745 RepID=UPI0033BB2482